MKVLENRPAKSINGVLTYSVADLERADHIRKLRKKKHIDKEKAARMLDVSIGIIMDVEAGRRRFENNDEAVRILSDYQPAEALLDRVKQQSAKRKDAERNTVSDRIERLDAKIKELQSENIKMYRRIIYLEKKLC